MLHGKDVRWQTRHMNDSPSVELITHIIIFLFTYLLTQIKYVLEGGLQTYTCVFRICSLPGLFCAEILGL